MNHPKKTPAVILLAFASLVFAGQAHACKYDWKRPDRYAKCLANEAADKIADEARKSADKIIADANNRANGIRNDATQTANKTLHAALSTAKTTKAAEPQICD